MNPLQRYNDYSTYLKRHFPQKMQKIAIHAGFTCPNRDGTVGYGGCTYCNNQTFNPSYCFPDKSIERQIDEGIFFFRKKYPEQRYLAYFQAYTNTYASLAILKKKYEQALRHPMVDGLIIGTRPDCVDETLLDYLADLRKKYYVMVEYGVESTCDETLLFINRGHTYETAVQAVCKTAERNIETCAHLILGLPHESEDQILRHADRISQLPLSCVKLHQLQLIKGTVMAQQYDTHPEWFRLFTVDEYIDLVVRFVERLHPNIVIERFTSQSPKNLLAVANWGLKNYEFVAKLEKRMNALDVRQGVKCKQNLPCRY